MGDCIFSLLELATARKPSAGIFAYAEGQRDTYNYLSYGELRSQAIKRSQMIRLLPEFETTKVILLHFSDHLDNILWYWAVLYSGKIPAMSTPFPLDDGLRSKHLYHLKSLFENPICLTRADIAVKYPEFSSLNVFYIDDFNLGNTDHTSLIPNLADTSIAALMLTSGSTGDSKAVCLTHRQIMASVRGKATIVDLPEDCTFFNWVGIDHVAGLLETHLEALFLGHDQIHAQPNDLIENPFHFLELINKHRVGRTFAPNFFLANLVKVSASADKISNTNYDLSCLRCLVSGGEPNPVTTCTAISSLLAAYGAPVNAITPGFGMTETCAGCIYSRSCPESDLSTGMDYASLGYPVPGIEMRVRPATEVVSNSVEVRLSDSCRGEIGRLQVRGEVVFTGYYNNPKATLEAFTEDGWFDTGDNAMIDGSGALHIVGRDKEIIRLYSISISPTDIESCLDNANIPGATKGFFVCFSHYANGSNERICVVYLPTYLRDDMNARVKAKNAIAKVIMLQTGTYPYILPLDSKFLQRSTIGKLSRGKIKTAFLQGLLGEYQKEDEIALWQYQKAATSLLETPTEKTLWETISKTLKLTQQESRQVLDLDTAIFRIGISSLELIILKKRIEEALGLSDLPLITLMTHPTVRSLAQEIDNGQNSRAYQPVVRLRQEGEKTPVWLFHPGVGEVMVFLKLSKHINDRPVYALRARGFEENEEPFRNIDEAVLTYFNAIKSHQPDGPYALVGYSYGAMLAFETAKLLEHSGEGQQVRFLGSLNLPPHINFRMKQLDWTQCLYNLAYFLDLVSAGRSKELVSKLAGSTQIDMVRCYVEAADQSRVTELSLTPEGLARWVELAFGLSRMACQYEPSGTVPVMDVFHCKPLTEMMCSKEQWLDQHLSRWEDFCTTKPRFHAVEGTHYTILNKENVLSFSSIFQAALQERGL